MADPKGWWRIAVSNRILQRLDHLRKEMEQTSGEKISYNTLIERLLQKYRTE